MENEKLKDVAITLPDGTEVVKGMKIYSVERLQPSSYEKSKIYYRTYTGAMSSLITEHTVIAINQAANSRCFTVRSDRGCEHTYSVKNNCLPNMYGKRENAVKKQKEITAENIEALETKKVKATEYLEKEQKVFAEKMTKYKNTISALKKLKY